MAGSKTGAERIAAERQRQIEKEGYTAEHDDNHHDCGELALAAALYASPVRLYAQQSRLHGGMTFFDPWPWESWHDKRRPRGQIENPRKTPRARRIRMLERAGALIAAEIDRLLREEASHGSE